MKKEELRKVLKLDSSILIMKVEDEANKTLVYIKNSKKKARCPKCNCFSSKIHDYLKPVRIDYMKCVGINTYLIAYKRRFECKKCNKSFTEDLGITEKNSNISFKVKQNILKDCMNRDKTIKEIAISNNVSEDIVRTIFLDATSDYPNYIENLPEIVSFDEVSTYTNEGVYSFILNNPIEKYTIDILKNRNKDLLIDYFLKVKNRKSVKVVICDLYRPYY